MVKTGSTLPVKFKLTGASAGIADGRFYAYVTDLDASVSGETAAVSTSQATTGNLFRYDTTSGQYIFNMSTKGFVSGHNYRIRIDFGDGTISTVQFLSK